MPDSFPECTESGSGPAGTGRPRRWSASPSPGASSTAWLHSTVPEPIGFADLLEVLGRLDVEFVLVGGVAAILEGAPVSTFDLDIVFRQTPANRARLLQALGELGASSLDPAGRRIEPDLEKHETMRLHRLRTRHGVLDLMTEIGAGWSYSDLAPRSHEVRLGATKVRVLGLAAIIESKEAAGRDKDRSALPVLRRTLDLRDR